LKLTAWGLDRSRSLAAFGHEIFHPCEARSLKMEYKYIDPELQKRHDRKCISRNNAPVFIETFEKVFASFRSHQE
jgi:hypothetical protein